MNTHNKVLVPAHLQICTLNLMKFHIILHTQRVPRELGCELKSAAEFSWWIQIWAPAKFQIWAPADDVIGDLFLTFTFWAALMFLGMITNFSWTFIVNNWHVSSLLCVFRTFHSSKQWPYGLTRWIQLLMKFAAGLHDKFFQSKVGHWPWTPFLRVQRGILTWFHVEIVDFRSQKMK